MRASNRRVTVPWDMCTVQEERARLNESHSEAVALGRKLEISKQIITQLKTDVAAQATENDRLQRLLLDAEESRATGSLIVEHLRATQGQPLLYAGNTDWLHEAAESPGKHLIQQLQHVMCALNSVYSKFCVPELSIAHNHLQEELRRSKQWMLHKWAYFCETESYHSGDTAASKYLLGMVSLQQTYIETLERNLAIFVEFTQTFDTFRNDVVQLRQDVYKLTLCHNHALKAYVRYRLSGASAAADTSTVEDVLDENSNLVKQNSKLTIAATVAHQANLTQSLVNSTQQHVGKFRTRYEADIRQFLHTDPDNSATIQKLRCELKTCRKQLAACQKKNTELARNTERIVSVKLREQQTELCAKFAAEEQGIVLEARAQQHAEMTALQESNSALQESNGALLDELRRTRDLLAHEEIQCAKHQLELDTLREQFERVKKQYEKESVRKRTRFAKLQLRVRDATVARGVLLMRCALRVPLDVRQLLVRWQCRAVLYRASELTSQRDSVCVAKCRLARDIAADLGIRVIDTVCEMTHKQPAVDGPLLAQIYNMCNDYLCRLTAYNAQLGNIKVFDGFCVRGHVDVKRT